MEPDIRTLVIQQQLAAGLPTTGPVVEVVIEPTPGRLAALLWDVPDMKYEEPATRLVVDS